MPQIFVLPRQTALDDDANPLAGALLYFYQTGSTTPQAVYSDAALTTPHANPVVADSAGEFPKIYLNSSADVNYRVQLTTSDGVQLYQEDDIDRYSVSQAEIGRAIYPRTAGEISASVTPVNYTYPAGHLFRYGTNASPGTTDMTAVIQAAMDANPFAEVYIPRGTYRTTDSIEVYKQRLRGEAKEDVIIRPDGNFECFVNSGIEFITGSISNLTIIYNNGVKPSSSTGNDRKIGVFWEIVNGRSPNFFILEDIEVQGAWWGYYDETGSYGCTLERFFVRESKNGFYKTSGTTFHFKECITLNVDQAFSIHNALAFTFTSCANDGAQVITGNAANDFRSCTGLVINSWDSESNNITGNDSAMFSFLDCTVELNAWVGYLNDWSEASGFTTIFKFSDSQATLSGIRTKYNGLSGDFTGSGSIYGVLAVSDSQVFVSGSDIDPPSGGTPAARNPFHATGTSRIQYANCRIDGTVGSNSYELKTEAGEFTATLTGCTTSPTGTVRWRLSNRTVTMQLPTIAATSNTTSATLTGTVPASITPTRKQVAAARVTDNTVTAWGFLEIETNGALTLYPSANGGNFTSSGTKGVDICTFIYSLD